MLETEIVNYHFTSNTYICVYLTIYSLHYFRFPLYILNVEKFDSYLNVASTRRIFKKRVKI